MKASSRSGDFWLCYKSTISTSLAGKMGTRNSTWLMPRLLNRDASVASSAGRLALLSRTGGICALRANDRKSFQIWAWQLSWLHYVFGFALRANDRKPFRILRISSPEGSMKSGMKKLISLNFQKYFTAIAAIILAGTAFISIGNTAHAQSGMSSQEEELIQKELERIIAENPSEAENAHHALEKLKQPETSATGRQMRNRRLRGSKRIVNGMPAIGKPAVGALLKGNDPRTAGAWCTGTLVGCDKFLTAAHCIARDPSASSYLVFFQELGFFKLKRIDWNKGEYKFPYFDLAMLTLERPVEGIAPISINLTTKPLKGSTATIVGFGRTGGGNFDYGLKREGTARTGNCPSGLEDRKLLCWEFDADVKALASASNICNGDSGGGVFMADEDENGRIVQKVFGVVSGGMDKHCVKNDLSYNVDVHEFKDWLASVGEGRLSPDMCGTALWQSEDEKPVTHFIEMRSDQKQHVIDFTVPANSTSLRVALNGEDNGKGDNDFDLLVFQGTDISSSSPACREDGSGQFAFCEIKAPESGAWTAVLQRKKGHGAAQVTTSIVLRNQ